MKKVLIAGKSWTVHSIHQKGFNSFTTTEYAEGVHWLRAALEAADWQVVYQPSHVAARGHFRQGQGCRFHLRLWSSLGAAAFCRMAGLWAALGANCQLGGGEPLTVN